MSEWCVGMFAHKHMWFKGTPEKVECHVLHYFLGPFFLIWKKKSKFESHISGAIKGKSEKHWALTATLRKSSNKIIMKVYEQSIFWCTIFPPFKYILLLPSPAVWVALYHTTFSSQLFYFMIAIKIQSNSEEVSGDRAGYSCLTKHCPCD